MTSELHSLSKPISPNRSHDLNSTAPPISPHPNMLRVSFFLRRDADTVGRRLAKLQLSAIRNATSTAVGASWKVLDVEDDVTRLKKIPLVAQKPVFQYANATNTLLLKSGVDTIIASRNIMAKSIDNDGNSGGDDSGTNDSNGSSGSDNPNGTNDSTGNNEKELPKKEKRSRRLKLVAEDKALEKPSKFDSKNDSKDAERESIDKIKRSETEKNDPDSEIAEDRGQTEESITNPEGSLSAAANGSTPAAPGGSGNGNGGDDETQTGLVSSTASKSYPPLLAIAMKDRPQLPGRLVCIHISDAAVIKSMNEIVRRKEPHFVLFHMKNPDDPDTDIIHSKDSVHEIGVHCQVFNCQEINNVMRVLAYPMNRCRLEALVTPTDLGLSGSSSMAAAGVDEDFPTLYLKDFGVSYALISNCHDEPYDLESPEMRSILADAQLVLAELARIFPQNKSIVADASKFLNAPEKLADMIGSITNASPDKIQEILLEFNVGTRLKKVLQLFKAELEAGALQEKSLRDMSASSEEAQSKALIKDYIKNLQKNAGLVDPKESKTQKFEERLKHLKLTEEAMEAYQAEKEKLENPSEHLAEQSVSEKYLDWITSLPWGVYTKDRFNLKVARDALDRDHYGLKELKERILEFISMGKVSGKIDGKILCLVGPPGTGKTSIAKSIAEALNRKYARIAVGGIKDVHEIKGHKRTYIGSIPGRIISSLKQAKTSNPLLLIDEIDKIDVSAGGAPASALLEVLDPEQNNGFVDNYIDVKVDLSKVLFVCTANDLGGISGPLRDRMEVIEVPGYTNQEKLLIAEKHLIPQGAKKAGIDQKHVSISKETLEVLIEKYCRESGLRNIKKLITRIFSKASFFIVEKLDEREAASTNVAEPSTAELSTGATTTTEAFESSTSATESRTTEISQAKAEPSKSEAEVEELDSEGRVLDESELQAEPLAIPDDVKLDITPENLKDYVGPEIYSHTRLYEKLPAGVSTGLSFNYSGSGDILHIESILTNSIGSNTGLPGINATGHLGDMMKESSQIAYSFARLYMAKKYPNNKFFEAAEIHINCPEGAIPKEGPSAGIAFVSSLISLATNEPLPSTVAMTGEITLTGKVLPIGGLREKILGAKRNGCTTVLFPKDIEKSLEEIPDEVKDGVTLIPVSWYDDVFDVLFKDSDKEKFGGVWDLEFARRRENKEKN